MSWTRPTLAQLQERVSADLSSRLLDGSSLLSRSVLRVLALVYAGAVHLLHGFLAWAWRQCWPDVAESEYLERWARIWNVIRKRGTRGLGRVAMSGAPGTSGVPAPVVPEGHLWRDSRGVLYRSTADAGIDATGAGIAHVQAVDTGSTANTEEGAELQMVSPVPGMDMRGVSLGVSGGTDDESDESLRARLLDKLQAPPHGGNARDYVQWAREVPGVTRAWVFPLFYGLGTVGVTFATDDDPGGPVPSQEMVDRVQQYISTVAPVTAAVVVFAPVLMPVNVHAVITPYSVGLAERIKLELRDLFVRQGGPGQVIPRTHIAEAISITPGEFDHTLLAPTHNIVPGPTQLPVLGTVNIGEVG